MGRGGGRAEPQGWGLGGFSSAGAACLGPSPGLRLVGPAVLDAGASDRRRTSIEPLRGARFLQSA